MKSDSDLLRSYVDENCGEAFTEIVRRNVSLVHSCVLRRVGGDSQLAEDVTQRVFSDLARKAPVLTNLSSVSGWLYVGANLASAEVVRKEKRRKAREVEAVNISDALAPGRTYTHDEWNRIRDLIDDLICEMSSCDREAVVLRFFSMRTYLEIAREQEATEEGSRKRVNRALEKLRLKLAKSGITSSTEALEAVLSNQPSISTPERLVDRVASIAVVEFGATGAATSWLLSIARVLTSNAAALGAALAAVALLIVWQHHRNVLLKGELERLQGQSEEIGELEQGNRRLTHKIAEAEDLRSAFAKGSSLAVAGGSAVTGSPVRSQIKIAVTADGRILWEDKPVDLEGFLGRLVALHSQDPESQAQLIINTAPGAAFSPTAYVVEQASKAGFRNIAVNSEAIPTQSDSWITAVQAPPAAADKMPPTIPDVTVGP